MTSSWFHPTPHPTPPPRPDPVAELRAELRIQMLELATSLRRRFDHIENRLATDSTDHTDLWHHVLRMEHRIMGALDDLQLEVGNLQAGERALGAAVASAFADLQAKVASGQGISEADVEAAAAAVHAVTEDLARQQADAEAADPGAPAPAPEPTPAPEPAPGPEPITPTPQPPA